MHRHYTSTLRFHYCSVTSSSTLSRALLPPASLRSSPSRPRPLFLLVFSLSLFLFPLRAVVSRCSSSSLSSAARRGAARRRPDERDNSSSIRLSTASLFGPLPITLFLLLSALREDFDALSVKGEQARSLQLQSGAMHSRGASTRRSLIRTQGDAIKNSYPPLSPLAFPDAFYTLRPSNGFRFSLLSIKKYPRFAKYFSFQFRNVIEMRTCTRTRARMCTCIACVSKQMILLKRNILMI